MARSSPSPAKNKDSPRRVVKLSKHPQHAGKTGSSKIVYVIRHGEGQHQIKGQRIKPEVGPALTRLGIMQARALRPKVKSVMRSSKSTLVVSSNLLRAIQTALYGFPENSIVVQPLARERIANEHDHPAELRALQQLAEKLRSKEKQLAEKLGSKEKLASKALLNLYNYKKAMRKEGSHSAYLAGIWADDCVRENGKWADWNNQSALSARARELTAWLEAQSAKHIFLVSHGAFIMNLTGDSYFDNAEMRKYVLKDGVWTKGHKGIDVC